jgi:hypothetical protein
MGLIILILFHAKAGKDKNAKSANDSSKTLRIFSYFALREPFGL